MLRTYVPMMLCCAVAAVCAMNPTAAAQQPRALRAAQAHMASAASHGVAEQSVLNHSHEGVVSNGAGDGIIVAVDSSAQDPSQLDLFYNYYIATGGGTPAALYLAPRPVPATVGHVYYTNQALLPHEYLYRHLRDYYTNYGSYHDYGGNAGKPSYNVTRVRYARGTILPTYWHTPHPATKPNIPGQKICGYGCDCGCCGH